MSRRVVIRSSLVVTGFLALGAISSLALNVVSTQPQWPGPLDYAREHPWWFVAVATAASMILLVLDRFWASDRDPPRATATGVDMSGAKFLGPVSIAQGDDSQIVNTPQATVAEGAPQAPVGHATARRPVILYAMSPFLDNGGWEEEIFAATRQVNSEALCVPLNERNREIPDVAVILVVLSAAQYTAVRKRMLAKLKMAKVHYPEVRLILVAVDLADEPIEESDGHQLLKSAGYSTDQARVLICVTEDQFQSRISSHIGIAISASINQSILDSNNHDPSTGRELES